jgi:hypothetical protein
MENNEPGWVNTFGLGIEGTKALRAAQLLRQDGRVVSLDGPHFRANGEADFQVAFIEFETEHHQDEALRFLESLPGFIEYTFG